MNRSEIPCNSHQTGIPEVTVAVRHEIAYGEEPAEEIEHLRLHYFPMMMSPVGAKDPAG